VSGDGLSEEEPIELKEQDMEVLEGGKERELPSKEIKWVRSQSLNCYTNPVYASCSSVASET
jgi:hypothetical protein